MAREPDRMRMMLNPLLTIDVAPVWCTPITGKVPKRQWVAANANMIEAVSAERWLWALLHVLETGPVYPDEKTSG